MCVHMDILWEGGWLLLRLYGCVMGVMDRCLGVRRCRVGEESLCMYIYVGRSCIYRCVGVVCVRVGVCACGYIIGRRMSGVVNV